MKKELETRTGIEPDVMTLGEIFSEKQRKYVIPGYQRPYEWDFDEHISGLLDGLLTDLDNGEYRLFGTLQMNDTGETLEIIDGQQRLTTFSLIIRALGGEIPFEPHNNIGASHSDDLKMADDPFHKSANQKYRDNFKAIEKYLSDKFSDKTAAAKFLEHINTNVVFVVIRTNFADGSSLVRTLQIFEALNTTGLSLDSKDLFKTMYFDYLNSSGQAQGDIFERINNVYSDIVSCKKHLGPPYAMSEDALLYIFRLFIIGSDPSSTARDHTLAEGNTRFFESRFGKAKAEHLSLETFEAIAKCITETQRIMRDIDSRTAGDELLYYAYDLTDLSRYWKLKYLLYIFVYVQSGTTPTEEHVKNALSLTELIWVICSVVSSEFDRVRPKIYGKINEFILGKLFRENRTVPQITAELKEAFRSYSGYPSGAVPEAFVQVLRGDIFNSKCRSLFVTLSDLMDSGKDKNGGELHVSDMKSILFYIEDKKRNLEVEHIASRHLYDENDPLYETINQIGNLTYLEHSINESFSSHTKKTGKTGDKAADLNRKLGRDGRTDRKSYKSSDLPAVHRFLSDIDGRPTETEAQLSEIINERNTRKQNELVSFYRAKLSN